MYFTTLPILLSDQTKDTSCFTNHPGCGISNANINLMNIWSTFQPLRIVIFTETQHNCSTKYVHEDHFVHKGCFNSWLLKVAKSCDTAEQFNLCYPNVIQMLSKSMWLYTRQLRNWGLEIRMLTNLSAFFPFLNKKPGITTQTICQNRFINVSGKNRTYIIFVSLDALFHVYFSTKVSW